MNGQQISFTLEPSGERLDKALVLAYPDLSRAQWQRLIKEGHVLVNGEAAKAKIKVIGGEVITAVLPPTAETDLEPEDIPLDILYEDDDLLAINKPAGMVVHPAIGHESGTLVNAVLFHCPETLSVGGEKRPGIVHRLDKDTSGVILVAKNDKALTHLQAQFKERTLEKEYLALCEGHIQPESAMIDAPIGRDPRQRKQMAVIRPHSSATSRPAQTSYELAGTFDDFSLVRCFLHTGRTHQIRVHLAYIGFPIVGDLVYGRRKQRIKLKRHFLHAAVLRFTLPSTHETITIEAPLPLELEAVLESLQA